MLSHSSLFPVVLSSPPSSSPSTPPPQHSHITNPTPPPSFPSSPDHHSSFQSFPSADPAPESEDGRGREDELARGGRARGEGDPQSSFRNEGRDPWEDSHHAASPSPSPSPNVRETILKPALQPHPRLCSIPSPLPWETSPTSSMSTLSRLEESSRGGDNSPPLGLDEDCHKEGGGDADPMRRYDEYGDDWRGGAETWRLGVDIKGRRGDRSGYEGDKYPESRAYAAHVFSNESSSGELSPSLPHRHLPPTLHSHGYSIPADTSSPIIPPSLDPNFQHMSPFPSFETLTSPSSIGLPSPFLRTTSSRTTTTTTTIRTHVRGHSLSMPTSPPQRTSDVPMTSSRERDRSKSGQSFSLGVKSGRAAAASVRSWHSDESDEEEQRVLMTSSRRERFASETSHGMDASSRGGGSRHHTSSLRSSPSQPRADLPYAAANARSSRITSFQDPSSPPPSRSGSRPSTLHRARSSSSSHPGVSAFGFALPSIFNFQDDDDGFDNIATPSPTPALGGGRRKTTKSAPSSRVNLAAMYKAQEQEGTRPSKGKKAGGIFGLVKDGFQALHNHHQQVSSASSYSSSSGSSIVPPASPFSPQQPNSAIPYLSPHSNASPSRSISPSPEDSQALTILTRPIVPIAKFATLLFISFLALVALSSVLVGSYGLTAWDEGRLRIAGARERVEGGRRMIERGVERAREVVGEVMSGGGTAPEEEDGDGYEAGRDETQPGDRRRRDGGASRRPEKRNTEEAFKQLHEAAIIVVRRFLPTAVSGLLFPSPSPSISTSGLAPRSRKRSGPSANNTSSKRHIRKSSSEEPQPVPRTAPPSSHSSRRPSFSTPMTPSSSTSADERENPDRSRPCSRRPSYRTPSPSPTRESRFTFNSPGAGGSPPQEEKASSPKTKRGGATSGLLPRPPLGILIPSIALTIFIAVCALVGGFIKGWQGRGKNAAARR